MNDLVKPLSPLSPLLLAILACLAAPSASAQSTSPSAKATAPGASDPVLNPGDAVTITVWRKPELSGEFEVAPDGSIAHPLYREVKVAGVPISAAEERVRVFLSQHELNAAFIMAPLLRVIVGGEVQKPGLYKLPPTTTVTQALAVAGGPTERGRLDEVRVAREGRVVVFDLTRPDSDLTPIRSGDHIVVPRRRRGFSEIAWPASSVVGAVAALVSVIVQLSRR